jgi:hypothetical protein
MENFFAAHAAIDGSGFTECARLTAGEDFPIWLLKYYQGWSSSILLDIGIHVKQPTKRTIKKRLEEIARASALLERELQDAVIVDFLEIDELGPVSAAQKLAFENGKIRRRAEYALRTPILTGSGGKTKAGAGRALPPMGSSPQAFCAAVVLEAWAHIHHGNYPAPSNEHLATIANELWRASGGLAFGWGDSRLPAWRPYFKQALEPPLAKTRNELKRHIIEHEHAAREFEQSG